MSNVASILPVFCGLFGISDDFAEEFQNLDERFIKNKTSTFFFQAKGESMIPTVFPGDILVVDRSLEHFEGKVCVVGYNGDFLCKRVFYRTGKMILESDNSRFKPLVVSEEEEVEVWGVVTARASDVN